MKKAKKLQTLLRQRLPRIKRWTHVSVYGPGDDLPDRVKDTQEVDDKTCFIYWNGRKSSTNHHDDEIKAFPVAEIDKLIARNTERLKSKREGWK